MFTQSAYKDPSVMVNQMKEYFISMGNNNGWQRSYVDGLLEIVDVAYENQYSLFKFNATIVSDMLIEIQDQFEQFTVMYTMNNVESIPKFAKVYNLLSEMIGTTDFIDKTESITPIIEETIIDIAEDTAKKSDETFDKFVPYVAIGLVGYFLVPKIIESIGEQRYKR